MQHELMIRHCLELAERGRGRVGINPLVGAVLVRNGQIIAEGWHEGFGLPHAERKLLQAFKGSIEPRDILYVNLEPCGHRGKTPPCTDIILKKGIKRLVYGLQDPNPLVSGKGIRALRENGVDITGPVERERCRRFNRGYISLQEHGRPWITLKKAVKRDGRIAHDDGSPVKITSMEQDKWAHAHLRATSDAILVGVNTVISDDPILNTRFIQHKNKIFEQKSYEPLRIVLDSNLRIPLSAKIVSGDLAEGTMIVISRGDEAKVRELEERGVKISQIPLIDGIFDLEVLWVKLTSPKDNFCGITDILVEGGPKTWRVFKEAGIVDEEVILTEKAC